ncbi:unnamed protein product [Schistosoma mattheei]|uniref:Uncharacterized protein n=1 Tax=Schistosoma mattheei TaxID=31246 RepID=A0A183PL76_9TREM|nr:unnamed protein product [Schistosoma mattheei]
MYNTGYEEIKRRHGLKERNKNEEICKPMCIQQIDGTIFPHEATRVSPNHTTQNQIDHICINKKFRSMDDMRTRRGADIASDHHLVVVKMKLKLKRHWTTEETITLGNTFEALQDLLEERTTMEDNRKGIEEALTLCQDVLGRNEHHHKECIFIETINNTEINNNRTRAEKVKAKLEYTEANKKVKRSIRADKQKDEDLEVTTEKAAKEGNVRAINDWS